MNSPDTAWLTGLRKTYSANGETEEMVKTIGEGMSASGSALIEASVAGDLSATATSFEIPRHPRAARSVHTDPLVEAYFAKVLAARSG